MSMTREENDQVIELQKAYCAKRTEADALTAERDALKKRAEAMEVSSDCFRAAALGFEKERDVALSEVERLRFALEQKSGEIGLAEHRGNTVNYIYDKCAAYGKKFDEMRAERDALRAECERLRHELAYAEGCISLRGEEIERLRVALDCLVAALDNLIAESEGVSGLHRNGDVATWDSLIDGEFDEWLGALVSARAALKREEGGE